MSNHYTRGGKLAKSKKEKIQSIYFIFSSWYFDKYFDKLLSPLS